MSNLTRQIAFDTYIDACEKTRANRDAALKELEGPLGSALLEACSKGILKAAKEGEWGLYIHPSFFSYRGRLVRYVLSLCRENCILGFFVAGFRVECHFSIGLYITWG